MATQKATSPAGTPKTISPPSSPPRHTPTAPIPVVGPEHPTKADDVRGASRLPAVPHSRPASTATVSTPVPDDERRRLPSIKKLIWRFGPLILAVMIALPATLPLFNAGYFWTHDGNHHVRRLVAFDEALSAGQFPVRYLRNWGGDYMAMPEGQKQAVGGLGGPIFIPQYQLSYYTADALHRLGFDLLDAYKAEIFLAIVLAAVFAYLWAAIYWGRAGGLIAAALYVWAPYLLHTVYLRGAWGELTARAAIPAAFWAVDSLIRRGTFRYFVLSALTVALTVLAHHYSGQWVAGLLALYGLGLAVALRRIRLLPAAMIAAAWAAALACFYWLPLLAEFRGNAAASLDQAADVREANAGYVQWQYLIPLSWQLGNVHEGIMIGTVQFMAVLLATIMVIKERSLVRWQRFAFWLAIAITTLVTVAVSRLGTPLWNATGLILIDVPYRLLGLVALFMAFASGALARFGSSWLAAGLFVVAAVVTGLPFAQPSSLLPVNSASYVLVPSVADEHRVESKTNTLSVTDLVTGDTSYAFDVDSPDGGQVVIKANYFPGWQVLIDGIPAVYTPVQGAPMEIVVSGGKHHITASFGNTPVRSLANTVSLIAWLLLWLVVAILGLGRFSGGRLAGLHQRISRASGIFLPRAV